MSGKNQHPVVFNWQATNPATTFLPNSTQTGSAPSGVISGVMTGTNTIYSQIIDLSRMDNSGHELTWTGTPTGIIQVFCSNSGANFYALTIAGLVSPVGSAGGYLLSLNQVPFKYLYFQYANTSGTGALTIYGQQKDLN